MAWVENDPLTPAYLNAKIPGDFAYSVKDAVYGATGNGVTDDTAAIQAAVDAAAAAGVNRVYVPHGTYLVSEISLPSNIEVFGSGWGTVIKAKPASVDGCIFRNESIDVAGYAGNENIILRDMKLDANNANMTGGLRECVGIAHVTGFRAFNLWCVNAGYHAFDIVGCYDFAVVTCRCEDITSGAIQIDSAETGSLPVETAPSLLADSTLCRRGLVLGNYVSGAGGPGVHFHKEGADTIIVDGNILDDCNNGIADDGTAYTAAASKVVLSNNIIRSTRTDTHGIALTSGMQYLTIANNVLFDPDQYGIIVGGSASRTPQIVSITGNVIDTAARSAIRVDFGKRVAVVGNAAGAITGSTFHALSANTCFDLTVADNALNPNSSTVAGIRLADCDRFSVHGNTVVTALDGIVVIGADLSEHGSGAVANNNVLGHTQFGIRVEGLSATTRMSDVAVTGNQVDSNDAGSHSIRVRQAQRTALTGNVVRSSASAAAAFSISDVPDALVTGNVAVGNGQWGIAFTTAANGVCSGNRVSGFSTGIDVFSSANSIAVTGNDVSGNTVALTIDTATSCLVADNLGVARGVSADRGDANVTLVPYVDNDIQLFATSLTTDRTVSLSTINAHRGARFRIVRTGLGAATLDVGGLKTIASAASGFVDVEHSGAAWTLTGYGTL